MDDQIAVMNETDGSGVVFIRSISIHDVSLFYTGVVSVFGLLGNLLCILMFVCSPLRSRSPTQYLVALSFVDAGFLMTVLMTWLKGVGVTFMNSRVICKSTTFFAYVCSFMSGWIIVAFTMERFVIVFYPLYRSWICTVGRARAIVLILTLLGILANVWVLGLIDFNGRICSITGNSTDSAKKLLTFSIVDIVLNFSCPSILIMSLNAAIACQISKSSKFRQTMTLDLYRVGLEHTMVGVKHMSPDSSGTGLPRKAVMEFETHYVKHASLDPHLTQSTLKQMSRIGYATRRKMSLVKRYNERRITILLVTLSMCYVVLNTPSYILRLFNTIIMASEIEVNFKDLAIWNYLFQMLFYTQFSVNFFLYSCQGRLYRNVSCVRATLRRGRDFSSTWRWRWTADGSVNRIRSSNPFPSSGSRIATERRILRQGSPSSTSRRSALLAGRNRHISFQMDQPTIPLTTTDGILIAGNNNAPEQILRTTKKTSWHRQFRLPTNHERISDES